jgi:hypothetical protein
MYQFKSLLILVHLLQYSMNERSHMFTLRRILESAEPRATDTGINLEHKVFPV